MPNKKITRLGELTSVECNDMTYVVEDPSGSPISKKCTAQNFAKGALSGGGLAGLVDSVLAIDRALKSSSSGVIETSSVTSSELGCLSGVTSAVQSQIDSKASISHDHDGDYSKWRGENASAPSSPASGDMYFNTADSNIYIYAGAAWRAL